MPIKPKSARRRASKPAQLAQRLRTRRLGSAAAKNVNAPVSPGKPTKAEAAAKPALIIAIEVYVGRPSCKTTQAAPYNSSHVWRIEWVRARVGVWQCSSCGAFFRIELPAIAEVTP